MRSLILALTAVLNLALLQAQTSLGDFHKIHVSGNVQLTLNKGSENSYSAENNLDMLQVKVENEQLKISLKHSGKTWDSPTYVSLTYREIDYIYASAGASVEQEEEISANDFTLFADTGARLRLTFNARSIKAQAGEGAVMKLDGETHVLTVTSNTGAIFKGSGLVAETVFAKANTGGQASVHAREVIEAEATIGGMISFDGNPEKQKISESMGGSVKG